MLALYTIGHSTRTADEFVALLRAFGVQTLVDVRTIPRSRRHPQFNGETLAATLAQAAIAYRPARALGGRRGKQAASGVANDYWRQSGFRNYADYALTPPFRAALADLESLSSMTSTAVMCAEALWWRCHRRIITDYLVADGFAVTHIMGAGKSEPASLTPAAVKVADGGLHYPRDSAAPLLPGF